MFRLPEFTIPEIPKIPELPELEFAEISIAKIKESSDEELLALLNGESSISGIIPIPTQSAITNELLRRTIQKSTKPHWSVVPSFALLILGTVAACVAAYPVLFPVSDNQHSAPVDKPSVQAPPTQNKQPNLPPPSLNSQSAPQGTAKK